MNDILSTADQAEQLSQSFITRISTLQEQVAAREAQVLEEAERYGHLSNDDDPSVRQTVKTATRNNAKREARAYRRRLVENTEAERTERLKALMAMDGQAIHLEPLFESPV
jgi:hypothetical protein